GKPALWKEGYHRFTSRYDERGNSTEETYFGTDGKPTLYNKQYARLTKRYDEKGTVQETAYWIVDDKGQYVLSRRTDGNNREIEGAYFTPAGRPTIGKAGDHRWTHRYDERGNAVEGA